MDSTISAEGEMKLKSLDKERLEKLKTDMIKRKTLYNVMDPTCEKPKKGKKGKNKKEKISKDEKEKRSSKEKKVFPTVLSAPEKNTGIKGTAKEISSVSDKQSTSAAASKTEKKKFSAVSERKESSSTFSGKRTFTAASEDKKQHRRREKGNYYCHSEEKFDYIFKKRIP